MTGSGPYHRGGFINYTYPTTPRQLDSLFKLLYREQAGDFQALGEIEQTIARYERERQGAHELELKPVFFVKSYLCYMLGSWLRSLSRADRTRSRKMLRPIVTSSGKNAEYRKAFGVDFVRGLFGREYTSFDSINSNAVCCYQPGVKVPVRTVPAKILNAFLKGLGQLQSDRQKKAGIRQHRTPEIVRATFRHVAFTSARGNRRFVWRLQYSTGEIARACFTLPFNYVDQHTRRYCYTALKNLLAHYRRLGPENFAHWVINKHKTTSVKYVLAILPEDSQERSQFAQWACEQRPKINIKKQVLPMLRGSQELMFRTWLKKRKQAECLSESDRPKAVLDSEAGVQI